MTEVLMGSLTIVVLVVGLAFGLVALRRMLVPSVALDVAVNGSMHLEAQRGDALLGVLHKGGVMIPAACGGSGTCGLCRVTVTGEGAGEPQATERGVLSPGERRAHMRLACQTRLRGDCDVGVPDDILTAGGGFTCTVASVRMLAPLIREIVVDLPEGAMTEFRAGDFMQITAPPYALDFTTVDVTETFAEAWRTSGWRGLTARSDTEVTRAYSLANRPEDAGRAVFNIRLAVPPAGEEETIPTGVVSSWLFSVAPGDPITLSGPFGEFHVQDTGREMVFVGGGVGMAPLRAMIHQQLGRGTTRRLRYFYGSRSRADLFYADAFEALAAAHENFSWTPALSDPAPGDRWTGATGFIHETLQATLSRHDAPEECEYYLCGPPVMISAVLATLERLGVEPASIFYDDFGA
ncbi:NADH:ubiquinone reductase (Na(+)-transporting) subunit F [Maritimibacter sp. UBA3975]|uniref:NADH:ubiquinone reductase (Na(+)-transporting) subunit F n=1 Tax=Maritimibacter sp. UBA3975 TaxID=1946833 RepID=UPI000C09600B|nr:NADH:ubiquinone reductase (Na(+)-transporting) subunit F [Maritimibacter sp. UBA3975]MAM60261.1 NADH:ubiquinone reductase (Na(+)-transporting) subunit F [Maritimibacter sp.]|tara:strand:+ start:3422 stop:4645 length:1224 start_codon:yes stop_codon:yes gene_type:complete